MMQVLKDIGGVEFPETLVKLGGEKDGNGAAAPVAAETERSPNPAG